MFVEVEAEYTQASHAHIMNLQGDASCRWQYIRECAAGTKRLPPEQRLSWLKWLHRNLNSFVDLPRHKVEPLLDFAGLACDWHLQIELYRQLDTYWRPQDIITLSFAYWKSGQHHLAFQLLQHHMLTDANDENLFQFYSSLQQLEQGRSRFSRPQLSGLLSLEPLSFHHQQEFYWQYFDPKIAELCCLPNFIDANDWQQWLSGQQQLGDQLDFAIMHQQWGFIGVVSLIMHRGNGFFYFWLGQDFQHKGLGSQAVELLLELGKEQYALKACFAKVFKHNTASQKAMQKVGFQCLPFAATEPSELFFYRGQEQSTESLYLQLEQILLDMNSETQLAPPSIYQILN